MKPATIPNPVSLRALKTDHLGQQLWHDAPFEQGTRNAGNEAVQEVRNAALALAAQLNLIREGRKEPDESLREPRQK